MVVECGAVLAVYALQHVPCAEKKRSRCSKSSCNPPLAAPQKEAAAGHNVWPQPGATPTVHGRYAAGNQQSSTLGVSASVPQQTNKHVSQDSCVRLHGRVQGNHNDFTCIGLKPTQHRGRESPVNPEPRPLTGRNPC